MATTRDTSFRVAYGTRRGVMYRASSEILRSGELRRKYRHRVQLIFTSPPFPLNTKKAYGNLQGNEYVEWLADFAPVFSDLLKPDGSIVIELGNAWERGRPVMSTLALKALLAFQERGKFALCQQFVCHNPARLPTPAQWVTVDRIRVKDSYTHIWWLSPSDRPKANNRNVPKPYSATMLKLLASQRYNSGRRPSEHNIRATSFLKRNDGAIPSNVLTFANTTSRDPYLTHCAEHDLTPHPARMPSGLAHFFIKFLTSPRDLVLDPFAGSNTTGAAAELLKRRWASFETDRQYIRGSRGRFTSICSRRTG